MTNPEGITSNPVGRSQGTVEKNKIILGKGIRKGRLIDLYRDSCATLNKRSSMIFSSWSLTFPEKR
jgi:hypothetical protein